MAQLDQQRERTQDDLRGLVSGEVRCEEFFLQLHAGDGGPYEIQPLAVVRPRSAGDVVACVRYAAENNLAIRARGAGTTTAGESLGSGIVLDFSKYLRHIVRLDAEKVRVQPGIVVERLNAQLRSGGRLVGIDPGHPEVSTVGGMIAVDYAGSRWLKYGSAADQLLSMHVVLADGTSMDLGREQLENGQSVSAMPRKRDLINDIAGLLRDNSELIRLNGVAAPLKRCGYNLDGVLGPDFVDFNRLLAGSEGTLALITEATLALRPLRRHVGAVLFFFESLDKAARAATEILQYRPTACELSDRRFLSLARGGEVRLELLIPAEAEAALLVEFEDEDAESLHDRVRQAIAEIVQERKTAFGSRQAFEADDRELFWRLADASEAKISNFKGPERPTSLVDDLIVAPEYVPEILFQSQNAMKKLQITATLSARMGQGQIRLRPILDLNNSEDVAKVRMLAEELYAQTFAAGGNIVGSNGYGFARAEFLRKQAGPLYGLIEKIKATFDPTGVLNPGKIIVAEESQITNSLAPPLKIEKEEPAAESGDGDELKMRSVMELQLDWDPARLAEAAEVCTRCGLCRTQASNTRMCPIFRLAPSEEASPRAKVNLLRSVLTGAVPLESLTDDTFKEIADLCVHCHMCRVECPVAADVPSLMRDGKGAYVAAKGVHLADWTMIHIDLLAALGMAVRPLTNWALRNRQTRWILEKTLGIAQNRKIPPLASRSFLRTASRKRLTKPVRRGGGKVLYFFDTFVNYFDPQLGLAAAAVLEHNGIGVYVHPDQMPSGMPMIATGALDHARIIAEHNVALLADAVRQGYHIVATEPSAAICLTYEYPRLVDDDDAKLVAANSSEACSYLWRLHQSGKLQLDLKPIYASLGYHMPCHMKALKVGSPGEQLMGLIPGVRLRHIEAGCSGMAGTYGLSSKHFRGSVRMGMKLFNRLRSTRIDVGATECSACKMHMEQGAEKPVVHPLKLLAASYDLMPEIKKKLATVNRDLTKR